MNEKREETAKVLPGLRTGQFGGNIHEHAAGNANDQSQENINNFPRPTHVPTLLLFIPAPSGETCRRFAGAHWLGRLCKFI